MESILSTDLAQAIIVIALISQASIRYVQDYTTKVKDGWALAGWRTFLVALLWGQGINWLIAGAVNLLVRADLSIGRGPLACMVILAGLDATRKASRDHELDKVRYSTTETTYTDDPHRTDRLVG